MLFISPKFKRSRKLRMIAGAPCAIDAPSSAASRALSTSLKPAAAHELAQGAPRSGSDFRKVATDFRRLGAIVLPVPACALAG